MSGGCCGLRAPFQLMGLCKNVDAEIDDYFTVTDSDILGKDPLGGVKTPPIERRHPLRLSVIFDVFQCF